MSAAYAKRVVDASPSVHFVRAQAHAEDIERRLQSKELLRAEHAVVEVFVETQGREWARLMA